MHQSHDAGSLTFERRLIGAICCASAGLLSGGTYALLITLHLA